MDYLGLINAIKNVNDNSYMYGNEVLYKMADSLRKSLTKKDPKNDDDFKKQLAGAIWLIGRAYAASPQRRSYGKEDGKSKWIVKTSNDGREGFFEKIAENMELGCLKDFKNKEYSYNGSDEDYELLKESIVAVLEFNLALSKSIEKFDEVKENSRVKCNNHISFCSKFLHFFFPHSIFIIDNYAFNGGKSLFNGNDESWRYICDPVNEKSLNPLEVDRNPDKFKFSQEVYDKFQKKHIKTQANKFKKYKEIKDLLDEYQNRTRNQEGEDYPVNNYIDHCVRSYILGTKLKKEKIKAKNQIIDGTLKPMPRLTDMVFLNIKKKLSKKEKENLEDRQNQIESQKNQ